MSIRDQSLAMDLDLRDQSLIEELLGKGFIFLYSVHQTLTKEHWRICFDTSCTCTLDKTGIETLLVDEDDIERDRESLMHFDNFLYEDNQAHFLGEWMQALML